MKLKWDEGDHVTLYVLLFVTFIIGIIVLKYNT